MGEIHLQKISEDRWRDSQLTMKIMLMLSVAGVVLLEVDSFSEEVALCLSFATVPLGIVFFSGALYTKGADVGIVGVTIDFVVEVTFFA